MSGQIRKGLRVLDIMEEIRTGVNRNTKCKMLVSFADNLCKQFGPRSGPTKCQA